MVNEIHQEEDKVCSFEKARNHDLLDFNSCDFLLIDCLLRKCFVGHVSVIKQRQVFSLG